MAKKRGVLSREKVYTETQVEKLKAEMRKRHDAELSDQRIHIWTAAEAEGRETVRRAVIDALDWDGYFALGKDVLALREEVENLERRLNEIS